MKVACILVLIDREQGGAAEIAKAGYNLCSAFKVSELLELYLASGRISKDVYDEIEEYRANN
jgi:orotate phosphoribosyltransferase